MTHDDHHLWDLFTRGLHSFVTRRSSVITRHVFSRTIDLHGMTVNEAHTTTRDYLKEASQRGEKSVMIITGRSGIIRREFPSWLQFSHIRNFEELNGGGAFKIYFFKKLP
jgi:DNA-nicking Smr family endonuclease